jgi:hypothetical protein
MTRNRHKEKLKTENTFRKRVTQREPISLCYLSEVAWGVGKNFGRQLELKKNASASEKNTSVKSSRHPIDNQQAALIWYTAERLFLNDYVQKKTQAENHLEYEKHSRFNEAMSIAKQQWKRQTTVKRRVWEAKARQHDAEQPYCPRFCPCIPGCRSSRKEQRKQYISARGQLSFGSETRLF